MKNKIILILYLLIPVLLLNCNMFINHFTPDNSQDDFSTGVKGQVFIGPITPVEREGIINKAPYEALLKFADNNGNIIKKIKTDENGKFETALGPGNYTIIPESINKTGRYPIGKNKEITINPGEVLSVEIDFDSGIR